MKALNFSVATLILCANSASASPAYSLVQGIDRFEGSAAAWRLLETNGFVVADPVYGQIFEPYLDTSFPPFITTDSAWDTYQALFALGVRQLEWKHQPNSDLFARTNETFRAGGQIASGLDFFVASPELRSPATVRALRQISGTAMESTLENLNYTLPSNSLASESLQLLATLQQPVSSHVAPAFHSDAWADEQLWSQLGAWIEQPRRSESHPAPNDAVEPPEDASKLGAVAPYPEFFAGLAQLSRDTQAVMEKAGLDEAFDPKAVAQKMLNDIFIQQGLVVNGGDGATAIPVPQAQFQQFDGRYSEKHHVGGGENSPAAQQLLKNLEAVARRCLAGTVPTEADQAILQGFYDERRTPPRLLRDFAVTCDKLADLASKQANTTPLSDGDRDWIENYGATLAQFHSGPADVSKGMSGDFPAASAVATNSNDASVLCAGLGRPETLYIILPAEGRLHLFRGAVLSYREGLPTNSPAQESEPDRDLQVPDFTASFRAEKSPAEILDSLASGVNDRQDLRDIQQNLAALESRVTDANLPMLIATLGKSGAPWAGTPIAPGIAAAIARLNWAPAQKQLLTLLTNKDDNCAAAAATILLQHPNWLDGDYLCANFDRITARARRVYLLLLTHFKPNDQNRAVLLGALRDDAPSVRWQAVPAVREASWDPAQKIPPLLDRLSDTNDLVAAAAARALGKVGTASVAPILFSNLQQRLQAPALSDEKLMEQRAAIQDYLLGYIAGPTNLFDPDGLLGRGPMSRRPRFLVNFRREQQFTRVSALIEALGDLRYQPAEETLIALLTGPNAVAAANALKQIALDKLSVRLTSIANDKTAPPQARDRALALLGDAAGANAMAGVIPLLDDQTVIPGLRPMPGREWRICDRAAATLSALSGRPAQISPMMQTEDRDRQIEQVRQMLKSSY